MKLKNILNQCKKCKLFPFFIIAILLLITSGCMNITLGDNYICESNETYIPKYYESWCLKLSEPGKICYQYENTRNNSKLCKTGWRIKND